MKQALLFVSLSALSVLTQGQSAQQFVLDTSSTAGTLLARSCITTEGDIVMLLETAAGRALWKGDAQGNAIWMNDLSSPLQPAEIAPWIAGGVLLAEVKDTVDTEGDPLQMGIVTAYAADGSLVWRTPLSQAISPAMFTSSTSLLRMKANDAGEVFLIAYLGDSEINVQTPIVSKLNSSGELVWSRIVGEDDFGGVSWQSAISSFEGPDFSPDLTGGGYLASCGFMGPGHLVHLNADGEADWAREIDYANSAPYFELFNVLTDGSGNAVITGAMQQPGTQYAITGTYSPVGQYLHGDLYQGVYWQGIGDGTRMANGNLLLNSGNQYFLEVAPDGSLQHGVQVTAYDSSPLDFTFIGNAFGSPMDRVALVGNFTSIHEVFGYTTRYPTAWSFYISEPDGCMLEPFTCPHYSVPDTILVSTPIASYVSEPVAMTLHTDGIVIIPRTPILTSSACGLLVGVAENQPSIPVLAVNRILLLAGDPLTVTSDLPLRYSIVDVKGATVWNDAHANQRLDIPAAELTLGLYTLMGRDVTGQVVGTAKVIVER